ncbi:hypothetical protein L3Q82_005804 [Scortum barcoo]|uniref:Uncharacterized protein n=1 Tax=Scortum barcoo TaxID=214431 RepID=A0ACB8V7E9_9TELE|nr:hypothetical protein L3Q82_005804 [Scortum barcoo]
MEREIDRRIGAASAVMRRLSVYRTVVVKKELSRKAKLSIYRSIYVPTLTYGHELWGEKLGHSGGARESRCYLRIERSQLRWLGHLFRMPPGRLPRECSRHVPPGGGLGKTQDTLEKLCLSAGLGTPRGPPEELEEVSGDEGSLGISAQTAASATRSRTKRMKKMKMKIFTGPGHTSSNDAHCSVISCKYTLDESNGLRRGEGSAKESDCPIVTRLTDILNNNFKFIIVLGVMDKPDEVGERSNNSQFDNEIQHKGCPWLLGCSRTGDLVIVRGRPRFTISDSASPLCNDNKASVRDVSVSPKTQERENKGDEVVALSGSFSSLYRLTAVDDDQ